MAQDATGTPTSQGIPKYNTAADSPSGKGFNAAMDAIDALIVARGLPGTPDTNEPLYWNGSAWVTNKLTDAQMDMTTIIPPGIITPYGGSSAPAGWVICDGAAISRTTYVNLFNVVGTQFGIGDGSTTFNVPNMKGRVPVGIDAVQSEFDTRGKTGGAKTHTLTIAQMPSHSHGGATGGSTVAQTFHPGSNPGGGGWNLQDISGTGSTAASADSNHTHPIGAEGGGGAHNILQPYMALHYIIKL